MCSNSNMPPTYLELLSAAASVPEAQSNATPVPRISEITDEALAPPSTLRPEILTVPALSGVLTGVTRDAPGSIPLIAQPHYTSESTRDDQATGDNPHSANFQPKVFQCYEYPTPRDTTFTFLWKQVLSSKQGTTENALPSLRCLAKACHPRVVQSGSKRDLIFRLMLHMQDLVDSGKESWSSAFNPHRTNFFDLPENQTLRMLQAPPVGVIKAFVLQGRNVVAGRSVNSTAMAGGSADPPFSNSEFARLMALLTTSESARAALLRSGGTLERSELDAGVRRDDFWVSVVEKEFNDHSNNLRLDLSASVDDRSIDASAVPLAYRTGAKLKDMFFQTRGLFTRAHRNWSASGQNDNGDDLPFSGFVNTVARTTTLSAEGKRCCIMFAALRCGGDDELHDLLDFTKKTAPHGIGYDDDDFDDQQGRRHNSRKKRRTTDMAIEMNAASSEAMKEMAKSISSAAMALSTPFSSSHSVSSNSLSERFAMIETLKKLVKMKREIEQDPSTPEYMLEIVEKEIEATRKSVETIQSQTD